jgi:pimeloyl-ACP methyl ester carboxylesterase
MSAGSAIDILSAALPKANITEDGPGWILVAHENGALYSQVFASRHTSQVKGMLFVDGYPSTMIPRIYTPARTFLLLLRGIISPLGVDRLSDWIFKHRSRIDRVYGASSWRSDRVIKSQFQESLAAGAITCNEIIAAEAIIPERIPVTVVSSGIPCKDSKEWEEGQRYLGRKSEKHVWDVVGNVHRDLWKHDEGRRLLKKRLGQLVKGR